jgi:hypothetical protein
MKNIFIFFKIILIYFLLSSCSPEREILSFNNSSIVHKEIIEGEKLWDSKTNQGLTNDETYYYVSNTHSDIEKRKKNDHSITLTNRLKDKYGGLFFDKETNEILTAAGVYKLPYKAYVNKLNKNDLSSTHEVDLSAYFNHGINAIVKLNGIIYIGETAVEYDSLPKKWVSFDSNFNYIQDVYSSTSYKGINDWQDATVHNNKIYATDHYGFINIFTIKKDGKFNLESIYNSNKNYHQGITFSNGIFKLHKSNYGVYNIKID